MEIFDETAMRLKQALGVKTDKAVAAELGLSQVAWTGRKKRGNFPETELYALATKRPDLKLDVPYVLTGITSEAHARLGAKQQAIELASAGSDSASETKARALAIEAGMGVSAEEATLLADWRGCDTQDRATILQLAHRLRGRTTTR